MEWLLIAAIGAIVGAVVIYNWEGIVDIVSGWLRENGYEKSSLMDVLIQVDRFLSRFHYILFAKLRNNSEPQIITDEIVDPDDIEDPDVRAQLEKVLAENGDTYTESVMYLIN